MSKLKIGIIFGGRSKEREISFAGGRTVYDNLNKSIFEAIPLFVDSFGNFVLLDWQFVYKGTIRDFYPPVEFLPANNTEFQYYAENLGNLSDEQQNELISKIGKRVKVDELKSLIDFNISIVTDFSISTALSKLFNNGFFSLTILYKAAL